jgi:hypothetical protein
MYEHGDGPPSPHPSNERVRRGYDEAADEARPAGARQGDDEVGVEEDDHGELEQDNGAGCGLNLGNSAMTDDDAPADGSMEVDEDNE